MRLLYIIFLLVVVYFVIINYDNKLYEKFSNGDTDNELSTNNLENLQSFLRDNKPSSKFSTIKNPHCSTSLDENGRIKS